MVLVACSVFDVKASAYMQPFFVPNTSMAIRSFGDAVVNPETGISKHPEDFQLFKVGEFDDNSGLFSPVPVPEYLSKAVDFLNKKEG